MSKHQLPAGGIAIAGRTGSGKSSWLFGSEYVRAVFLTDLGSQAHKIYFRHDAADLKTVDHSSKGVDPVGQVMDAIAVWTEQGKLWALDSWTTLTEHQCVWHKRNRSRSGNLSMPDYREIVGRMRDVSLFLSQYHGMTLFNTAPGGVIKLPDGTLQETPKGSVVGLPALTGVGAGSESILARWTTVLVAFPGATLKDGRVIPRGFLLPWKDLRPAETSNYTPIKDPLALLEETLTPAGKEGEWDASGVDAIGPPIGQKGHERPGVDVMLDRLFGKFPKCVGKEPEKKESKFGIQNGKDLAKFIAKKDAELSKAKFADIGELAGTIAGFGVREWQNGEAISWNEPDRIAKAVGWINDFEKSRKPAA